MKRPPLPARSSPMARSTALTRTGWKRRKRARTDAESEARALVAARAQGRCEACGKHGLTDWAHRVGRAQGGRWCATNGLALCRSCHEWCDHKGNRDKAEANGWMLRRRHDPATTPAQIDGYGPALLTADGRYLLAEENVA